MSDVLILNTGDVIDSLPAAAAEHLRVLRTTAAEAQALRIAASEAREDARVALQSAQMRLTDLAKPRIGLPGAPDQIALQQTKVERAQAEFDRQRIAADRHAERFNAFARITSRVDEFLRTSGLTFADAALPEAKLLKGEDVHTAVGRVRVSIDDLKAKLEAVRSAPVPSSVAIDRMGEQIARLAKAPDVTSLLSSGRGEVEFARTRLSAGLTGQAGAIGPDAIGVICWLWQDEIVAKLTDDIVAQSDDDNALDDASRQQQEAALQTSIMETERLEESFIRAAEAQGRMIARRANCSPIAVLSVTTSPRQAVPPGTSPEHVTRSARAARMSG